jgi:cytochrome c-type biogenesis protein
MDFSDIASTLSGRPLVALPLLFAAGVLTSLTPCIYPMIPITAAIVGGHSAGETRPTRWRPLLLSLTYSVGLAVVYSALGLFAGLTGTLFGTISTNPWLYFAMANLLVIAGLAMLDVIPVRMPSGLVAAPCSAPVMAAVLTWVTTTKSAWLGFAYLFAFSLGMCALLVAVGVSSGAMSRLPRAGVWMLRVKKVFAFVMLGVAEYYLIKMGQLLI